MHTLCVRWIEEHRYGRAARSRPKLKAGLHLLNKRHNPISVTEKDDGLYTT